MACPPWGREAESLLLLLLVCGDRRVALACSECPFCGVSCHPFHPHPASGLLIPLKKKKLGQRISRAALMSFLFYPVQAQGPKVGSC